MSATPQGAWHAATRVAREARSKEPVPHAPPAPLVVCSWRSCTMHVRRSWWSVCKAIYACACGCMRLETHVTSKFEAVAGRCTREGDMKRRSGCCMRAAASISTTWLDLNITLLLDHPLIHAYTHSGAARQCATCAYSIAPIVACLLSSTRLQGLHLLSVQSAACSYS